MGKIKGELGNSFCPQALFLYGNYQDDGRPHFGLFSWATYCSIQDEDTECLGFMACIGEEKLTKDLIRKQGVFSANLVNQALLPLADYYGTTNGREEPHKMDRQPTVEPGQILQVPTIAESPVSFELKVIKEHHLAKGSDLFLCRICNVMIAEGLTGRDTPFIERLLQAAPVLSPGESRYTTITGNDLGGWGEPRTRLL